MKISLKQIKYGYGKFFINGLQSSGSGSSSNQSGGTNSVATGTDTSAVGDNSQSQGTGTIAVGDNSSASGAGQETLVNATASLNGGSEFCTFSSKVSMEVGDVLKFVVDGKDEYRKVLSVSSSVSNTFITIDNEISNQDVSDITVYKVYGVAIGENSHVEGNRNIAYGENSHAEGSNTIAGSNAAHSEGWDTRALGIRSHTEGSSTIATATDAHAEGSSTQALSSDSHAEGKNTIAVSSSSHAEGEGTVTWGAHSHAEGYGQVFTKSWTVSCSANSDTYTTSAAHDLKLGQVVRITLANGSYDYVAVMVIVDTTSFKGEQPRTTPVSNAAVAIIMGCTHGADAHSEGTRCTACYTNAHAEGDTTIAKGAGTHAEGRYTNAYNNAEHAEGQYNISNKAAAAFGNAGNTAHSVGIGTAEDARKNAFEIMQNGDIYIYGKGGYDGTNAGASGVKSLQQILATLGVS